MGFIHAMDERVVAPAPPSTSVAWTRAVAMASLLGLIALGLAWELWLAPTGSGWLAIKVLPLLLPLAGVWRMRLYTYRWVSLFVWFYFIEGAVRAASDRGIGAALGLAEVVLCLTLFFACTMHVRTRLRGARAAGGAI